jgi:tRNA pseudouridine55 synthase
MTTNEPNGILNINKPRGMTSHDVVFKLRKILHTKKVGHGGTLDPDVDGVLPIAVGKATRVLEFMDGGGKEYIGEVTIGFSTETEDASGTVVEETPVAERISNEAIDQAMQDFVGNIDQVPPMYSAVKINGRKLYEYARAGEKVERPSRKVTIHSFTRTSPVSFEHGLQRFRFKAHVSKGTYIRTLAVDLAKSLGYAGHMSDLTRTMSAGLRIEDAVHYEDVTDADFLPIEYGVTDLPRLDLTAEQAVEIGFGRNIEIDRDEALIAAFTEDGKLLAVLVPREPGLYKPRKVFQ